MLLWTHRVILTWSNVDFGVSCKHVSCRYKSFCFVVKSPHNLCFTIKMLQLLHFRVEWWLNRTGSFRISPRASIFIEILFKFKFAVKSKFFWVERRNLVWLRIVNKTWESVWGLALLMTSCREWFFKESCSSCSWLGSLSFIDEDSLGSTRYARYWRWDSNLVGALLLYHVGILLIF